MTDESLPQEELAAKASDDKGASGESDAQKAPELDDDSSDSTSEDELIESIDSMDGVTDSPESSFADIGGSATGPTEVKSADFRQLSEAGNRSEAHNLEMLLDVDLPVSIELGRTTMSIQEILSLSPGSVVELDKLAGEPVDLLVNNKAVAKGEVVVIDENFGLRVTSLISQDERLKSLGA